MTISLAWSSWREWTPREDNSIPPEIRPGVVFEADVHAPPQWALRDFYWVTWGERQTGVVVDGSSWMMYPVDVDIARVWRYRVLIETQENSHETEYELAA